MSEELRSGTLWDAIVRQSARARESGDLQPLATDVVTIEEAGARFVVRVAAGTDRKPRRTRAGGGSPEDTRDPFLPPYQDGLFVTVVSRSHVALLNKYPVVEHHLLVVTRDFEPQESALAREDFAALWACMREFDSLGFYNAGYAAGASQPHKHLQLVPLPLCGPAPGRGRPALPIEPLLAEARLPWASARTALSLRPDEQPSRAAPVLEERYRRLLGEVGLASEAERLPPYNLLVTRSWMAVVPRSREEFEGLSVNALGFAGSLFVPDAAALARVREVGPLAVLAAVGVPSA